MEKEILMSPTPSAFQHQIFLALKTSLCQPVRTGTLTMENPLRDMRIFQVAWAAVSDNFE